MSATIESAVPATSQPAQAANASANVNTEKSEGQTGAATAHQPVSLYVGGLDPSVTEAMLFELFSSVGLVASIRVCRDAVSRRSLGYAYVNYNHPDAANTALNELNYTLIKDKPCRIMWSNRDPSQRRIGKGNIFIKNLDTAIDDKALHDTFAAFGEILSSKVAIGPDGKSYGYGFVHFKDPEAAEKAIASVNGMLLNDKKVFVAHHVPKKDRQTKSDDPENTFTNIHIKNLDPELSQDDLCELFSKFGKITSASISKKVIEINGVKNTFGFINYDSHEAALKARNEMQGSTLRERKLEVNRAMKQEERREILRREQPQKTLSPADSRALYVKQLPRSYSEEDIKKLFTPFGTVEKCSIQYIHLSRTENSESRDGEEETEAKSEESPKDAESTPVEEQSTEEKPAEEKPAEEKPAEEKPAEEKAVEENTAESKPAESKDDEEAKSETDAATPEEGSGDATDGKKPRKESSGVAYVFMSNASQASEAIAKLNKKMIDGMPLYVAYLVPRETRRAAMAEVHRSQFQGHGPLNAGRNFHNRPMHGAPPMVPGGFPGQYAGRGVPGQYVGVYPVQQWQNPGQYPPYYNGRGPAPGANMPYPPKMQQIPQTAPMGGMDAPIPGPGRNAQNANPVKSSEASAQQILSEDKRKIGEKLYPQVYAMYSEYAGKLTGMLLEATMQDLEEMLSDDNVLKFKIQEAYEVYMQHLRERGEVSVEN